MQCLSGGTTQLHTRELRVVDSLDTLSDRAGEGAAGCLRACPVYCGGDSA